MIYHLFARKDDVVIERTIKKRNASAIRAREAADAGGTANETTDEVERKLKAETGKTTKIIRRIRRVRSKAGGD